MAEALVAQYRYLAARVCVEFRGLGFTFQGLGFTFQVLGLL